MDLALFNEYLMTVRSKRKPLTAARQKQIHSAIERVLQFSDPITPDSFHSFLQQKTREGCTLGTLNKYIQAVKHWGRFKKEAWVELEKQYEEEQHIPGRLSNEEMKRFLEVPKRAIQTRENYQKWQLFWHIAFFCGLRMKEIRTLEVENIDLGNKLLLLKKTKSDPRMVTMMSQLLEMTELRLQELEGRCVFPSPTNPNIPMSDRSYIKDWKFRIQFIGITRRVIPYDTRHTAITRWIQDIHLNPFDIKRLAGHKELATTERYYAFAGFDGVRKQQEEDPHFRGQETAREKFMREIKNLQEKFLEDERFELEVSNKKIAIILRET